MKSPEYLGKENVNYYFQNLQIYMFYYSISSMMYFCVTLFCFTNFIENKTWAFSF